MPIPDKVDTQAVPTAEVLTSPRKHTDTVDTERTKKPKLLKGSLGGKRNPGPA